MKHKVLLLDDDEESVIHSLHHALSTEMWDLVLAESVEQAIDQSDAGEADLVMMVLDSPMAVDWQAITEIREENPILPVIVITRQSGLQRLAESSGVRALLRKPVEVVALLQTIRELLAELPERRNPTANEQTWSLWPALTGGQGFQKSQRLGKAPFPLAIPCRGPRIRQ